LSELCPTPKSAITFGRDIESSPDYISEDENPKKSKYITELFED
jgi:hypothetical protein